MQALSCMAAAELCAGQSLSEAQIRGTTVRYNVQVKSYKWAIVDLFKPHGVFEILNSNARFQSFLLCVKYKIKQSSSFKVRGVLCPIFPFDIGFMDHYRLFYDKSLRIQQMCST